jgi:AcrR family transcriptional regulator
MAQMEPNETSLKPKERRKKGDDALLLFLAAGLGVGQAAAKAGVSRTTAWRRFRDPDFRARLAQTRAATLDKALGDMLEGSPEMVRVLRDLANKAEEESIRMHAAKSFLELTVRLRQTVHLEQRLAELELEWRKYAESEPTDRKTQDTVAANG